MGELAASAQASCEDRLQTYVQSIFPEHTDQRPDWTGPPSKRELFEVFLDCWKCLPSDRFQLEMIVLRRLGDRRLSPGDRVQVSLICRAWQEWAYCMSHVIANNHRPDGSRKH